jgi:ribosomal protein S17
MYKLVKCECKHEYQDKKYGRKMRLCNKLQGKNSENNKYRCTVCGTVLPKT